MAQYTITRHDPTPSTTSDPEFDDPVVLLRRLAERDERAWRHVVLAYRPAVVAQANRFRLDPDLREDLLQWVWLLLLEHADQIRNPAALPGWLSATARHEAERLARRRRREVSVAALGEEGVTLDVRPPWSPSDQPDIDTELLQAERLAGLGQAMTRLPVRQRAVLGALMDGESSYLEISARLGMPVGSIGPTRLRAIRRLRGGCVPGRRDVETSVPERFCRRS